MKIAWIKSSAGLYENGWSQEIYISGCKHNCKGCQNPQLQYFGFGEEMSLAELTEKIKGWHEFGLYNKIVLTGGDPLWSKENTIELIKIIKKEAPELKIWLYTGFTREEIQADPIMEECFNLCDVVVTDRYIERLRVPDNQPNRLAGSSNQRIWRKSHKDLEMVAMQT